MDPTPKPAAETLSPGPTLSWQASVTVWATATGAWSARAVLADRSERVFDSPFELARFFARPGSIPTAPTRGLR